MSLEHSLLLFEFTKFRSLEFPAIADNICEDCNGNTLHVKLNFFDCNDGDDKWLGFTLIGLDEAEDEVDDIVQVSFIIRNTAGKIFHEDHSYIGRLSGPKGQRIGNHQFIRYSEVVDKSNNILNEHGTLNFYVDLQYKPAPKKLYAPPNPLAKNLLSLLDSGDDADVKFEVQGEEVLAHKLILKTGSPLFASLCEGANKDTAVEIEGTEPKVLRLVLRHIYGETAPDKDEIVAQWKDIITAADTYSVDSLKMLVETIVIQECIIDTKNVTDYILFADAKTCPLLKEYAISYFIARGQDILDTPYSEKLEESAELMKELLIAVMKNAEKKRQEHENGMSVDTLQKMTVDELRKKLAKRGLDVDGSKEMLASRLEEFEASKRQRTE